MYQNYYKNVLPSIHSLKQLADLGKIDSNTFSTLKNQLLSLNNLYNNDSAQNSQLFFDNSQQNFNSKNLQNEILKTQQRIHQLQQNIPQAQEQNYLDSIDNEPFFNSNYARQNVKEFLKQNYISIDKASCDKISQLIELLEDAAVQDFKHKLQFLENVKQENSCAKSFMNSFATSGASNTNGVQNYSFNRQDLQNMSPEQFARLEPQIMQQLQYEMNNIR